MFNEDKNKKTNLYKAEKSKNLAIKNIKDLHEYKGVKDIRYLLNDNICKSIIDIRYLFNGIAFSGIAFNEDYYIENIKSEFNKLSNNLVEANTKDISYMVDYIYNCEKLEERPINLEDIKDKFIAYSDYLPFGILSKLIYIDLNILYLMMNINKK